jgi:hypothetical protein
MVTNLQGGGSDPNDRGTDQPTPPNQQRWPPEGFLVTSQDLHALPSLGAGDILPSLESMIHAFIPTAEVRASEDLKKFGFWITPSPDAGARAARQRALQDITVIPKFEFLLSLSPAMFYAITQRFWHDLPKKQGSYTTITLDRFDASLVDPNELVIAVHGTLITMAGDILPVSPGFDYRQTNRLMAVDGRITSFTTSSLNADPRFLNPLKDLLGADVSGVPDVGQMFADRLPRQILLPHLQLKFLFKYREIHLSPETGILIQIQQETAARKPRIDLTPLHATVPAEARSARVEVRYTTHDLRDPAVQWHAEGQIQREGHGAFITFSLPAPRPRLVTRAVRATATDADGGTATAETEAQISSTPDADDTPQGPHRNDR